MAAGERTVRSAIGVDVAVVVVAHGVGVEVPGGSGGEGGDGPNRRGDGLGEEVGGEEALESK